MKKFLINIFKLFLKFVYFFLKLLPTDNKKIVFISRQTNEINLDFKMIKEELESRDSTLKMVFLCKRMGDGILEIIKYFFIILKQMYHISTSKVCVIDSYCIPVCILKHKKSLYVLQIWHSIGKIKKSGYQTLGSKSGRSKEIAELMCMHKNYDNIIAGGKAFNQFYVEGFNCKEEQLLNYGLPRSDNLLNENKKIRKEILKQYPELNNGKINVYYAPTFRKYDVPEAIDIVNKIDLNKVNLIVRFHPKQQLTVDNDKVFKCEEFSAVDLLTVSDYIITDYSSICLDALVLDVKLLFYVFDHDKYLSENGINLDSLNIIPSCSSKNIEDLVDIILENKYDIDSYKKFKKNYLPTCLGKSTELIANKIMEELVVIKKTLNILNRRR